MRRKKINCIPPGFCCDFVVNIIQGWGKLEVAFPDIHCCVLAFSFREGPEIIEDLREENEKLMEERKSVTKRKRNRTLTNLL